MFIRYNAIAKIWEYDSTSLADPDSRVGDGKAPWLPLPIDYSQIYNPPTIPPAYVLPATVAHKNIDNNFIPQTLAETTAIRGNNNIFYLVGLQSPVDQRSWRVINYGDGFLRFEAVNDAISSVQGSVIFSRNGAIHEHGKAVALGEWTAYTPAIAGGSAITVSGGSLYAQYTIIGKTIIVVLTYSAFTITAGAGEFWLSLPPGITISPTFSTQIANTFNYTSDGSTWRDLLCYSNANGTTMKFYSVNYPAGSINHLWGTFIAPIG